MSRKLIRQTLNQWRSNIWLIVELMVVASAIWYMTDKIMSLQLIKNLPLGYEVDDVFNAKLSDIKGGVAFEPVPEGTDTASFYQQGINTLLNLVKSLPMVEEVGKGINAMPLNQSGLNSVIAELDRGDSLEIQANFRLMTPEMIDVLRIEPEEGFTREDLKRVLREGGILLSVNGIPDNYRDKVDPRSLIGQRFSVHGDSSKVVRVGALVKQMRRFDFEPTQKGTVIMPFDMETTGFWNLSITARIKPGRMNEFRDYVESHREDFIACNVAIPKFESSAEMRAKVNQPYNEEIRNTMAVMSFLLVSIFLGIFGTFWFRTQERTGEVAIRKVNGATSGDILRRLIGESLLLLAIAMILSLGIDWLIYHYQWPSGPDPSRMNVPEFSIGRIFGLTYGLTFLAMAVMVTVGTWIPAWRAMRINPATALHDE